MEIQNEKPTRNRQRNRMAPIADMAEWQSGRVAVAAGNGKEESENGK